MNNDLKVGITIQATDKASKAIKGITEQTMKLEDVTRKLDAFGKTSLIAGGVLTAGLGLSVKTASDFESAMKRVKALSGSTNEQYKALTRTARELGASTVFSATQAAEAMQFLSMAGYRANEQIDAMPGLLNLAAASQEELGTTADIVSNIISGFNMQAKESTRIADVLTNQTTSSNVTLWEMGDAMKFTAPMASALQISIEEASAAIGILGDAGIKGGMAGRNLNIIIARLTDPPKEAADAINQLGVSVLDSAGEFRGLQAILSDVKTATENMTSAQRAAILSQIAGQDAAKSLLNLVSQSNTKLIEYTENNKKMGTAARVAREQNESFTGALKELRSAVEELQIATGNTLLPTLTGGIRVVKSIVDLINLIPTPIKGIGVVISAVAGITLVTVGALSLALSALLNTLNILAPAFTARLVPAMWSAVLASRAWLVSTYQNIAASKIWTISLKDSLLWLNANKLAILTNTRALIINSAQGLLVAVKNIWKYTGALAIQKASLLVSTAANLGFAGSFRALGAAIIATPLIGWIAGLVTLAIILVQNWDKVVAVFKKFLNLASNVPGLGFLKNFGGTQTPVAQSAGKLPKYDIGSRFITQTGLAIVHQGEEIAPAGTVKNIFNRQSGGSVVLNYNPTISVIGGGEGAKSDFAKILNQHKDEIVRIITKENERRMRLAY
ncbi:MAG TPA: phage tail tape measure protein [Candidatus Gastranaerophilales bacterium]|nr:phage tail tape measure protein [Candidatus Gastranaerophilales bacterium]